MQEAWLRFRRALAAGGSPEQPEAYLFGIVRNLALDGIRQRASEQRRAEAHAVITAGDRPSASPEETMVHGDELRRVAAALGELPERTRRAFELHRFEGLTFQQIAGRLDTSLPTAQRLTQQALVHIMRRLKVPSA